MGTTVEFYGGLREIGASKVLVSTEKGRVLLDIGLPIGDGSQLLRPPAEERPGHELADRLRIGQAPALPGFWDAAQLPTDHPLAGRDRRPSAVFISHAHIDHDGCLGFVDPAIPAYAHADVVALQAALHLAGYRRPGADRTAQVMPGPMQVGDITVEGVRVDHDTPGASGFLVTTPDGTLAYTGDLNFHRGPNSATFVRRAAGVDMLITETTMLSWDADPARPQRSEDQVLEGIGEAAQAVPGLALVSLYERDVERCAALIQRAEQWGRRVIWPGAIAVVLAEMGVPGVLSWDDDRAQTPAQAAALQAGRRAGSPIGWVSLGQVWANPGAFLVQPDANDPAALLDLPLGVGSPWIHSQGEPLGPFMPTWALWQEWLAQLGVVTVECGSTGHAYRADLERFVAKVNPSVVVPIHGERPETLMVSCPMVLAEYGTRYDLVGRVVGC